ncbi:ABC transporter permease [Anoxynatronum sibiricum]|uniref:ABC transporter permease n=1 Tax=Anoxynatronum sibiricum TaxID=210623 RepID=A0ABU9VTU9_9CLOT
MNKRVLFETIRTLVAIGVALLLALIIIFSVSDEPGYALERFLLGPVTNLRNFGNVLEMAIPLIFTGLAISVMFMAKQFNLGAEGGFFFGAVGATALVLTFNLPPVILPVAAIIVGALAGGLGSALPAVLKARMGASELVSSLMMNFILFWLGLFIINNYFRDAMAGAMASHRFPDAAKLTRILPGTRLHFGIFIALAMVVVVYLFLYRSRWGYALRMVGLNIRFAEYSGINTKSVILYSQIIGGMIAGMGGTVELLGMYPRFTWFQLPGYGWDGVIVAIMARNNPLLVPVFAFFLAYLRIGADIMARVTDVPSEVVAIIQGVMIMLVTAERLLAGWRHRMVVKDKMKAAEAAEVEGGGVQHG